MKKILAALLVVVAAHWCEAQSVDYQKAAALYANPERGFYVHTETHSNAAYAYLAESTLQGYRRNDNMTLILRLFYLEQFRNSPISAAYLEAMQQDFNTLRKAGTKAIVRFAYTSKSTAPYGDAPLAIVKQHLEQLKPLLLANDDVIALYQAGFVGAWGEWYYTDYFSERVTNVTEADWANRRGLIAKFLEVTPAHKVVQVRTPEQRFKLLGSQTPVSQAEAQTYTTAASRIGHHNDCFLASADDVGTYNNIEAEKNFLANDTQFMPMGGETCGVSKPISDCENALKELRRFHWTYLNSSYHREVLGNWKTQGCFTEVNEKLGYDLWLKNSTLRNMPKAGEELQLELTLQNDGFANPFSDRFLQVVLVGETSQKLFVVKTPINLRFLKLNEPNTFSVKALIPQDMPLETYKIGIWLPDRSEQLNRQAAFAIRLRNDLPWLEDPGINLTRTQLALVAKAPLPGSSPLQFVPLSTTSQSVNPKLLEKNALKASQSSTHIRLAWPAQQPGGQVVLERNTGPGFVPLLTADARLCSYTDLNVAAGQTYQYRFYLQTPTERSSYSEVLTVQKNTVNVPYPQIELDGKTDDWKMLPYLEVSASQSFKIQSDDQVINLLSEGKAAVRWLFDLDASAASGAKFGQWEGIDYYLSNDSLYKTPAGSPRQFAAMAASASGAGIKEIEIPVGQLPEWKNAAFPVIYILDASTNERINVAQSTYFKPLASNLPSELTVRKSANTPESLLILTWTKCTTCTQTVIERSLDGITFSKLVTLPAASEIYRDENLTENQTYHYRFFTYNANGRSDFSAILKATPARETIILGTHEQTPQRIEIFPNPSAHYLQINQGVSSVEVTDLQGKLIIKKHALSAFQVIDIQQLVSGVYFLKLTTQSGSSLIRFLKNN